MVAGELIALAGALVLAIIAQGSGDWDLELFLALVGVIVVGRTGWRQALLLVAVIVTWAVGYALFVAKLRYRIPILPLLFVFTGAGAAAAYRLIRRATDRRLSSKLPPND